MGKTGQEMEPAAIFGASGGIGTALVRALAERGVTRIYAGARSGAVPHGPGIVPFRFDYEDPPSLAGAVEGFLERPPQLVIVATGQLTLADGPAPERSARQIDPETMERIFRINTIGPALVARHILPLLPRDHRSVFAALSARVGSI